MSTTDSPTILIIAGSDSSGGAGVAADLRALQATGALARLGITAVTAQSQAGVAHIAAVPLDGLRAQLEAAGPVQAIKLGMLVDAERVRVIRDWLATLDPLPPVVLDPVVRSTSGGELLDDAGLAALWDLFPYVDLLTPNRAEAQLLAGDAPWEAWAEAAPCPVLVTGGDTDPDASDVVDLLFIDEDVVEYAHPRVSGSHRGTGCQLATRIAVGLARQVDLEVAIGEAIEGLSASLEP